MQQMSSTSGAVKTFRLEIDTCDANVLIGCAPGGSMCVRAAVLAYIDLTDILTVTILLSCKPAAGCATQQLWPDFFPTFMTVTTYHYRCDH